MTSYELNNPYTYKIGFYYNGFMPEDVGKVPRPSIIYIKKHMDLGCELVGVEIGTYEGYNAESILKELPIKHLYLIDPYEAYDGWNGPSYIMMKKNGGDVYMNRAKERLREWNEKITFIRKKSIDAINDIPDDLDFVYIDGSHVPEHVREDIENYKLKVRKGGILAGHDYHNLAVKRVVHRCLKNINHKIADWWVVV